MATATKKKEIVVGTFEFNRSTKGAHVYTFTNDEGRKEAQYVRKSRFKDGERPDTLEVVLRYA